MATEVATEVYYPNDEKQHCFSPRPSPTPYLDSTHVSPHDSSITTDDEGDEHVLQRSYLYERPPSAKESLFDSSAAVVSSTSPHCSPHNSTATTTSVSKPKSIKEWTTRLFDSSSTSLRNVTESLAGTLCPSAQEEMVDQGCGDVLARVYESTNEVTASVRRQLELDYLSILGCVDPPTDDELVQVWPQKVAPSEPLPFQHRASIQARAGRIRRLTMERTLFQQHDSTGNGPPKKFADEIHRTRSMDDKLLRNDSTQNLPPTDSLGEWLLGGGNLFDNDDDDLEKLIGKGVEPIEPVEEVLAYDSDPGETSRDPVCPQLSLLDTEEPGTPQECPDDEHIFYDLHRARVAAQIKRELDSYDSSLEDTMNCTWTITWHPPLDDKDSGFPLSPTGVNCWIERGTILNSFATIVEPKLMWREMYQPKLKSRKLNLSFKRPYEIRLLAVCRVLDSFEIDRERYPFAFESRSFMVKTCTGQEFLFEAPSEAEKRKIVKSWKLVVARLASLAVVEDMGNMALEFFTPMVQNQMLTTY